MSSYTSISFEKLSRPADTANAPALLDVRLDEDIAADPRLMGERRRESSSPSGWRRARQDSKHEEMRFKASLGATINLGDTMTMNTERRDFVRGDGCRCSADRDACGNTCPCACRSEDRNQADGLSTQAYTV